MESISLNSDRLQQTYEAMHLQLGELLPDMAIAEKAKLVCEINELKVQKNAVILGHNYMEPALYHAVADIRGDSLELCRKAAKTENEVIVFCGVEFMAESAKILNPNKTVLIPSKKAGCSLASSITAEDVRGLKKKYPGVPVVTYINSYADVKAESDVCCTSSNAATIVESLKADTIIFLPDEYLAGNVARETGKHVIFPEKDPLSEENRLVEKILIGWHGRCEVHEKFTVEDITNIRSRYPDVVVLAHPECSPEVVEASDFSGSTSVMTKFVQETKAPRYLLLTECAMADNIIAENPKKEVLRLCSHRCPHMEQITLEDTLASLKYLQHRIQLPEDIRIKAKRAIDRMLELS